MNKALLVFKHEFKGMMTRRGFIIMTFIVPLAFFLIIAVSHVITGAFAPSGEITKIGFVDNTGGFTKYNDQGSIYLAPFTTTDDANKALIKNDVKAYIVIGSSYYTTNVINYYTLEKQLVPPTEIVTAIKHFMTSNMLEGKLSPSEIQLVNGSLGVVSIRLTDTGVVSTEQGGVGDLILPMVFAVLLYIAIVFSSSYLIQGLGDEKENRLIEVLLSSVSTRQLIIGKVLGMGAAGLISVLVWLVCTPFLLNYASSSIGGILSSIHLSPGFLLMCLVYFLLGYLLFAVISTCIGAITPSAREGQQLATIFTLMAAVPLWFSSLIIMYPNSPVCVFLTIFPVTAPVTLIARLGSTDVPVWQILVSVAVLLVTITVGLLVTVKIVRTFLLMYGKRPSLSVILRSLKSG